MNANYTACFTKADEGYVGQLLEWPEVITEGTTLEECRAMLIDAAQEMAKAYLEDGRELARNPFILQPLTVPVEIAAVANVC
ncbi:MAG: type II toxin-antitoxin system HicB family antitoxin [Fretibacterium sp.]|nr:type II toxin-antitoxin system HicB family antitoxin [Fretibacterium sp.]